MKNIASAFNVFSVVESMNRNTGYRRIMTFVVFPIVIAIFLSAGFYLSLAQQFPGQGYAITAALLGGLCVTIWMVGIYVAGSLFAVGLHERIIGR